MSEKNRNVTDPTNVLGYSTLCISMYHADRRRLDAMVEQCKAMGITRANRSWLIRVALARIADTVDPITEAEIAKLGRSG